MADADKIHRSDMESPNDSIRIRALESARGRMDSADLALVEEALGDSSWRVRKTAVDLIKDYPDPARSSKLLVKALEDQENAGKRTAAMEGLVLMGRNSVPHLLDSLSHPDEDVRKFIVDILGQIQDPAAIDAILPLTRDASENIRLASVETLGSIGGDHSFQALLSLLATEDVSLQFSVLYALGKIGRPIPVDRVRDLIEKRILRRAVYDSLGQTKSQDAIPLLVEGLLDSAKSARQSAVRALSQLSDEPGLDKAVEQILRKKFSGRDLQPFLECIETNHLATKQAAIRLLALLGSPEAVKTLVRAGADDSIQADVEKAIAHINRLTPGMVGDVQKSIAGIPEWKNLVAPRSASAETMTLVPMSAEEFDQVRELVSNEAGLFYDNDLKYLVERRVQRRMEHLKLRDYSSYIGLIRGMESKSRQELHRLIEVLSTNETYFFREDFQLKAFQEEILPALMNDKDKHRRKTIRIWSAGCSSGEEPYTIAILARESERFKNFRFEIMGSDISEHMVEIARQGLYSQSSFRSTPEDYLKRYFKPAGKKMQLAPEIMDMVSFDTLNLLKTADHPKLQKLDVIFCRNVIIYFSPQAKRKVVDHFNKLLNPGGYLLLGHSESLMSVSTSFELVHLKHDLVYRKPLSEVEA